MSDTKRTDTLHVALVKASELPGWIVGKAYVDMTDFARQLERELAAEREKVRELRESLDKIGAIDLDARGSKTAVKHIARATLENTK